jgi:hypothetical protein
VMINRGDDQPWPEPQPTPVRQPVPPGTPPGPANCPPEPQPTPGRQPWPPGPPPGPFIWPPEPQLPLASQPPPPGGSCLKTTCVAALPVAVPAAKASAAATGVTAIAAATAPPTTRGLIRLNFANMCGEYPLPHMCKTSPKNFSRHTALGVSVPVVRDVDDVAVRCPHKEPAQAPRLGT